MPFQENTPPRGAGKIFGAGIVHLYAVDTAAVEAKIGVKSIEDKTIDIVPVVKRGSISTDMH